MAFDPIFQALSPEVLYEAAQFLDYNPLVSSNPPALLKTMSPDAQRTWLDRNRSGFERELCEIGSWTFGTTKSYSEVVGNLAGTMGISKATVLPVDEVEAAIIAKVWNDAMSRMSPDQLDAVRAELKQVASKYGKSMGAELTGFAALSAAQLSGFGVYLLGSTILGAINGALGLGLSFGAFTGLSSLISVFIGPVGWIGLGLAAIMKLSAPNYKKILPVVILIGANRTLISDNDFKVAQTKSMIGDIYGQEAANSAVVENTRDSLKITFGNPSVVIEVPWHSSTFSEGLAVYETPKPAKDAPVSTEEICAIQEDIHEATEREKLKTITPASSIKLSKRDRDIFRLRNPELIRMAESMDLDYHHMGDDDQRALRELIEEQKALNEEIAQASEREKRQTASAVKAAKKTVKVAEAAQSALKKRIGRKRAEFRQLLENLTFTDSALEWLCDAPDDQTDVLLRELRHLNQGHFNPKSTLHNTYPKITEQEAGRDGRIYYRLGSHGSPTIIELIGTKATQEADIRDLQNR